MEELIKKENEWYAMYDPIIKEMNEEWIEKNKVVTTDVIPNTDKTYIDVLLILLVNNFILFEILDVHEIMNIGCTCRQAYEYVFESSYTYCRLLNKLFLKLPTDRDLQMIKHKRQSRSFIPMLWLPVRFKNNYFCIELFYALLGTFFDEICDFGSIYQIKTVTPFDGELLNSLKKKLIYIGSLLPSGSITTYNAYEKFLVERFKIDHFATIITRTIVTLINCKNTIEQLNPAQRVIFNLLLRMNGLMPVKEAEFLDNLDIATKEQYTTFREDIKDFHNAEYMFLYRGNNDPTFSIDGVSVCNTTFGSNVSMYNKNLPVLISLKYNVDIYWLYCINIRKVLDAIFEGRLLIRNRKSGTYLELFVGTGDTKVPQMYVQEDGTIEVLLFKVRHDVLDIPQDYQYTFFDVGRIEKNGQVWLKNHWRVIYQR